MLSSCVNSTSDLHNWRDLLKLVVERKRDERPGLSKLYYPVANP